MTVLRREDVQSKGASWDNGPYRIALSPVLAIVPRIIRRLRGPLPSRITFGAPRRVRALIHVRRSRLQPPPEKARQLGRDRDGDFRRRLVFGRQCAEASTQSLLR